jgi:hypothetical protein
MNPKEAARRHPCPCGSEQTFGACCGRALDAARIPMSPTVCSLRGDALEGGLTLYTMAKLLDGTEEPGDAPGGAWSPSRVRALSTEAIERELVGVGVPYRRERLLELIGGATWALEVARSFREHVRAEDQPFVYLATCELWARLSPDRPSVEMLDDWMQQGYYLIHQGKQKAGCLRWLETWEVLRPRFDPSMRTMADAFLVFNGTQRLDVWLEDMLTELDPVSLGDPEMEDRLFRWLGEWATQFPDETPERQYVFYQMGAILLFRIGNLEEAQKMLFGLIERCPTYEMSYALLSDALANNQYAIGHLPRNRMLAYGILAKGYTQCPPDAREQIEIRMKMLWIESDNGTFTREDAEREMAQLEPDPRLN